MKTSCGFSLVELMITVAILAIVAFIAVPSFTTMLGTNHLSTQTNDFISAIAFARSEAIGRNQSITLCKSTSASDNTCAGGTTAWTDWIVTNDQSGGPSNTLRRGGGSSVAGRPTVSSTLVDDLIVFRSSGLAEVAAGANTIRICYSGITTNNIRVLDIAVSGRVTVQTLSGGC